MCLFLFGFYGLKCFFWCFTVSVSNFGSILQLELLGHIFFEDIFNWVMNKFKARVLVITHFSTFVANIWAENHVTLLYSGRIRGL